MQRLEELAQACFLAAPALKRQREKAEKERCQKLRAAGVRDMEQYLLAAGLGCAG